jgi:apolipoprotein N-acyltransferase
MLWVGMAALSWHLAAPPRLPLFASHLRVSLTGARRGLAFGVGANLVALRFIPSVVVRFTDLPYAVGLLGLVLLALLEGTRWMVAALASEALSRARLPRALAFAAGVYAGTFVPTMIPWTVAGGVSPWPQMVQLADMVGERGVAAIMAFSAALAGQALRGLMEKGVRGAGALAAGSITSSLAIVGAQATIGALRMAAASRASESAVHMRMAVVGPAIEASTRWEDSRAPWILSRLTDLTRVAETGGAELVIWPEGAYPYPVPHDARRDFGGRAAIVPEGVRGPVVTGLLMTGAPGGAAYNSAVVAQQDGSVSAPYDKRHLLWFGETVPLADRVPLLRSIFARGMGLVPGSSSAPLLAGKVRAGILICYEDTLPEAGRQAAEAEPNLLINLTNDAWFTQSSESELHLRLAALRAVELRRDLVRSVNGGASAWVDSTGRVRARSPADSPASLTVEPALLDGGPTLYARYGDAPCALAMIFLITSVGAWRSRRSGTK